MRLQILGDEGLNGRIVASLRQAGFQVDWILEAAPGISDEEVIALAKEKKQVLITEDKDFGEWVFAHRAQGLTIIFLRYGKEDYPAVLKYLTNLLRQLESAPESAENEFITINKNKVRRRRI